MGNSDSKEEELKKQADELKKREEEFKKREEERIRQEILENRIREKLWKELELKEALRKIEAQQEAQKKLEQELQKREEALRRIEAQQKAQNTPQEEVQKQEEELLKINAQQEAQKKRQEEVQKLEEELLRTKAQQEAQKKRQEEVQKQEKELLIMKAQQEARKKRQEEVQKQKEELLRIKAQQEAQKKLQEELQKQEEELLRMKAQKKRQHLEANIKIDQMVQEKVRLEVEREKIRLQDEFKRKLEEEQKKEKLQKQKIFIDSLRQYKIIKNLSLINDLRKSFGLCVLKYYPETSYTENQLCGTSHKYRKVQGMFRYRNMSYFNVTKILEIKNPFLVLQYSLTKEKMTENNDGEIDESVLFHGTKCEYLDGICTFNFDQSKVKTHQFGWGISFSTKPYFATRHHKDNMRKNEKVMILAKVLVDEVKLGNRNTIIPEEPCYTTINDDKSVVVKFDDASFYPVYIVHYEGMHHFLNKENGSREQLTPNEVGQPSRFKIKN